MNTPMNLPAHVTEAVSTLAKVGRPLIVGGAVRDHISGSAPKDFDIEVHNASIDDLAVALTADRYQVNAVGKSFGVLKVNKGRRGSDAELDISVPRKENAVGKGHRDFAVELGEMTVEEAASRRDFTFNAIMFDPLAQEFIDPFNGIADLRNKLLRHVSEAFAEDPLRVLRGFQFAARFDLTMDPETVAFCQALRPQAQMLSWERIQGEFDKFFTKGAFPEKGLAVLRETGWDFVFEGLPQAIMEPVMLEGVSAKVRSVALPAMVASRMDQSQAFSFIFRSVVGGKRQEATKSLLKLIQMQEFTDAGIRKEARRLAGSEMSFSDLVGFAESIGRPDMISVASRAGVLDGPEDQWIMGRDILTLTDRKPGPWVGQLVDEMKEAQDRRDFATRDEAFAEVARRIA